MLNDELQERSLDAISLIAERLRDPEQVLAAVEVARTQTKFPFLWKESSFSSGFTSLALLYLSLACAFPGKGWEKVAHNYISLAAKATQLVPMTSLDVFGGSCGLALAMQLFNRYDGRYQKTYLMLNRQVVEQALKRTWRRATPGVAVSDYDGISGAAGVLRYLLSIESKESETQNAISTLLSYLIWLGKGEDEQGRKPWFISPELFPASQVYKELYPTGYFDLGLAHGISGPMAALSLAWQAGYRFVGLQEAIQNIGNWVIQYQLQDEWGMNWPDLVSLEFSFSPENKHLLSPTRTAWCYGAPGIARALWLAGKVLDDQQFQQIALSAIKSVFKRPRQVRSDYSPCLCHGTAGLLMIGLCFAHETQQETLWQECSILVEQLLGRCSPEYLFGIRNEESPGTFVDDPGLLTGAVGVALTLLAATTLVLPDWNRAFLLI